MATAMLEEVIDNGQKLKLMDGSMWAIYPGDMPTVATWIPTATIHVTRRKDRVYNYTLTNDGIGVSVSAMKLS
jgi:hypothetical protein